MARKTSALPLPLHADVGIPRLREDRLWLNLVERFFAEITRTRIRRGTFTSVAELEDAIHDYLLHHNARPKPFMWTKTAKRILENQRRARDKLEAVKNGNQALDSEH